MGRAKRGLVSVVKRWFTVDFKNQNQPTTWKKYKMKYIPKNYVILKTQDMNQNKTKLEWDCNISTLFQSLHVSSLFQVSDFISSLHVCLQNVFHPVCGWLWNKVEIKSKYYSFIIVLFFFTHILGFQDDIILWNIFHFIQLTFPSKLCSADFNLIV